MQIDFFINLLCKIVQLIDIVTLTLVSMHQTVFITLQPLRLVLSRLRIYY